jgi:hypothetical protein
MSIVSSAVAEMKAVGYEQGDIDAMQDIMRKFFDQWDSGGAVSVMIPVLDRLLRGLPLGPLTGSDDEWMCGHFEEGMCQNIRCGSVFKDTRDGRVYDIDNRAWDGTFPYSPDQRNPSPVVEIGTA